MSQSIDAQQRAATARRARVQRIHTLRMRVLAISVAVFLAAWVVLYAQLVSGHDPALANAAKPVATQSTGSQVADDDWSRDDAGAVSSRASGDTTSADAGSSGASSATADTGSASGDTGSATADAGSGDTSAADSGSAASTQTSGTTAVTTRQS